jgi:hypothetical protein
LVEEGEECSSGDDNIPLIWEVYSPAHLDQVGMDDGALRAEKTIPLDI